MTPLPSTATQEMNPDSQLATGGWAAKCTLLKGSLGEASIRARRSAAAFAWASLSICPASCANRGRQMRQRLATILKDMFSCHSRSYNPRRHNSGLLTKSGDYTHNHFATEIAIVRRLRLSKPPQHLQSTQRLVFNVI